MEIGQIGRDIIGGILDKVSSRKKEVGERIRLIGVEEFASWLGADEWQYCEWLLNATFPEDSELARGLRSEDLFGVLVPIRKQWYLGDGGYQNIETQFLPPRVYAIFLRLNQEVRRDLGVPLLLFSGFRSAAYQLYLLFYFMRAFDWDIDRTLRRVALPGWSEHGDAVHTALDLMTVRGVPNPNGNGGPGFETTEEYRWLVENAGRFGFVLSYPEGNSQGKDFEPWHWRYNEN